MFYIEDYTKKRFPVRCSSGHIVDASDGRRLQFMLENGCYIFDAGYTQAFDRSDYETASRSYLTSVFIIRNATLEFHLLFASRLNEDGLEWRSLFQGVLAPGCSAPISGTEDRLLRCMSGNVGSRFVPDLLTPRCGKVTARQIIADLFERPDIADEFAHLTVEELVKKWLAGELNGYASPWLAIKRQRFGVEIEFTGISRYRATSVLARFFGTSVPEFEMFGRQFHVLDQKHRMWRILHDASIRASSPAYDDEDPFDEDSFKCELVTPLCGYDDIPLIQQVVRELRGAGMVVNRSCGLHVHVDQNGHTASSLKNLVNLMASREELLFKALGTHHSRMRYCRSIDRDFLEQIQSVDSDSDLEDIRSMWYSGADRSDEHYDESRYHALNLHSMWQGKGIEFRMFNSTTHAGRVKAYIQLCLAISNQAKVQRWVSHRARSTVFEKRQFRSWLTQMGLVGPEYATARLHLLAKLTDEGTNAA